MKNHNTDNQQNYNICSAKGICSISPVLASIHAVIIVYIEQLAFYLVKLDKLGINNEKIEQELIEAYFTVVSNAEISQESLYIIIRNLYSAAFEAKELYTNVCERNNLTADYFKNPINIAKQFNITNVIKQGQKYFKQIQSKFSEEEKSLIDLNLTALNSVCLYLSELKTMNINLREYYKFIIWAFRVRTEKNVYATKLKETFEEYTKIDYELMKMLFEERKKAFGNLTNTKIQTSYIAGKSVLVAGNNLKELELFLEATKGEGINVYTHGSMISAHIYPKFKAYPHLIGHYGRGAENYICDFNSFKGPILLTKLSLCKAENLYSCNIFSTDSFLSENITLIKNYDFKALINSARASEGFEEDERKTYKDLGLTEEDFLEKINEIAQKIENNEIKYIFAIGASNHPTVQKEYFDEFLKQLTPECFVISCSYTYPNKNILHVSTDYSFPIIYKAFELFAKKKSFSELKVNMLFTRCEPHTLSNFFKMRKMGVKEIFFNSCSPQLVNPALVNYLKWNLEIKNYSNPKADFESCIT